MLAGVYLHIPFCKSRCSYCDFATGLYESGIASRYVDALIQEIESTPFQSAEVDTIYFGGGTPSMLTPGQLDRILEAVRTTLEVHSAPEITIEINPGSVGREIISEFRKVGINRASFGAQTFDDRELARLGRAHSSADTLKTYQALRDGGFENVSFDLIAGLPGQTMTGWQNNVSRSLEMKPEHLSFYLLEVHSGTPLAQHIARGIHPTPDEDLAGEMYDQMLRQASAVGYEHYEISNLAKPGFESKHNTKYWTGTAYYGFGCSAHSYDGKRKRWSNERDVLNYVEAIENQTGPITVTQELNNEDLRAEAVFLGMRLMRGLDMRRYYQLFGVDLLAKHQSDFDQFKEAGLIEFEGDVVRLTRSGALMSNEVFARFV